MMMISLLVKNLIHFISVQLDCVLFVIITCFSEIFIHFFLDLGSFFRQDLFSSTIFHLLNFVSFHYSSAVFSDNLAYRWLFPICTTFTFINFYFFSSNTMFLHYKGQ